MIISMVGYIYHRIIGIMLSRNGRLTMGKAGKIRVEPEAKDIRTWVTVLAIAVACIIAYYTIIGAGFLSDDFVILYEIENNTLSDIGSVGIFFRPLTWISFAIDRLVFGYSGAGFHIVNLILHFVAALGVAFCAQYLLRKKAAGLFAGLIFALHPAHPEAVSWIAGRFDVLCGALFVWSFYCYLKMLDEGSARKRLLGIFSMLLFALACLAKEMAFAFPLLILLYEFLPIGAPGRAASTPVAKARRVVPFFIIAAGLFILRWVVIGGIGGAGIYAPEDSVSLLSPEVLHQTFIQPFAVLFLPINRLVLEPAGVFSVTLFKVILLAPLLLLLRGIQWRVAAFCLAAMVISVLPTGYAGMSELELFGSRFLYIPSIFFSILIAGWFVGTGGNKYVTKIAPVIITAYFFALLIGVNQNNHPWAETGRLVESAVQSSAPLIEAHQGEWGDKYQKLLAVYVPKGHLGAHTFSNGFPEMLRLYYGRELQGVEIEVTFGGVQSEEDMNKLTEALSEGTIVWRFDYATWAFFELEP